MSDTCPAGVEVHGAYTSEGAEILTPDTLAFVARLAREFEGRRRDLLQRRAARQAELDAGKMPDFLLETAHVREGSWTVGAQPKDLEDRRVEITGPTDRKMIINALNSGASVFMADFEDANCPTWANMIEGQVNLRDAIARRIRFTNPDGKRYTLNDKIATLMVRPRNWHLMERHVLVDGQPVSGALFDFGLYFFHNAKALIERGTGPYFYLPKMESHLEARLWNDVFNLAQDELRIPRGTIKAAALIETIVAAFEMDEILYELREHSAGLNVGRWDYIFNCIKKFRRNPDFCLAERRALTMFAPFMRAYSQLLIKTCHARNAPAIGGMAALIPIKNNPQANDAAFGKVRADKEREATDGCDGCWVAHPALVPIAKAVFDLHMPTPNQIHKKRDDVEVTAKDLLNFQPEGPITESGLRINVSICIQYIGAWLAGNGAVPIFHLMEDAATAEISRSLIWLWIRNQKGVLDDGRKVTKELFLQILQEELAKINAGEVDVEEGKFDDAAKLFERITLDENFVEFLTLPAYDLID